MKAVKRIIMYIVLAIVVYLIGIIFLNTSKKPSPLYYKVQTKVNIVRYAFEGFLMDNNTNVFPVNQNFEVNQSVLGVLSGTSSETFKCVYIELSDTDLRDYWNKSYWCRIVDCDQTNKPLVRVWSEGPNKRNDNGQKDDINSWENNYKKWKFWSLFSF